MKETIVGLLEEFEENKRVLNEKQQKYIKENYNTSMNIEYAEGHLCYIFKGKIMTINNLKYFVGLEYEEESVETYIEHGNEALIVYEMSDRVSNFVESLQKLE